MRAAIILGNKERTCITHTHMYSTHSSRQRRGAFCINHFHVTEHFCIRTPSSPLSRARGAKLSAPSLGSSIACGNGPRPPNRCISTHTSEHTHTHTPNKKCINNLQWPVCVCVRHAVACGKHQRSYVRWCWSIDVDVGRAGACVAALRCSGKSRKNQSKYTRPHMCECASVLKYVSSRFRVCECAVLRVCVCVCDDDGGFVALPKWVDIAVMGCVGWLGWLMRGACVGCRLVPSDEFSGLGTLHTYTHTHVTQNTDKWFSNSICEMERVCVCACWHVRMNVRFNSLPHTSCTSTRAVRHVLGLVVQQIVSRNTFS